MGTDQETLKGIFFNFFFQVFKVQCSVDDNTEVRIHRIQRLSVLFEIIDPPASTSEYVLQSIGIIYFRYLDIQIQLVVTLAWNHSHCIC